MTTGPDAMAAARSGARLTAGDATGILPHSRGPEARTDVAAVCM